MPPLQPCCRCLARLHLFPSTRPVASSPVTYTRTHLSPFTTTSPSRAQPAPVQRQRGGFSRKKKARTKGYKVPAPGERKALRKRIVLSNINALDVPDLEYWPSTPSLAAHEKSATAHAAMNPDEKLEIPVGRVASLPNATVDSLRALETFKPSQRWDLFRRPSTLLRPTTLSLIRSLEDAGRSRAVLRRLITGPRGCGKSVLLLQAHAAALRRGWIVMHIPAAQELTSAATAYAPLPESAQATGRTLYQQKDYTAALLGRIAKANPSLRSMTLQSPSSHANFPVPLQSNISLDRLAQLGAADPDIAWPVFRALWTELTLAPSAVKDETQRRPPLVLSLEGIAHACRLSLYVAPDLRNIHGFDLALVDHFVKHLSPNTSSPGPDSAMPNGAAVLAVDDTSNRPASPSLDFCIRLSQSAGDTPSPGAPTHDPLNPHAPQDPRVLASLHNLQTTRVPEITLEEARALLEYYAKSGIVRSRVDDGFTGEMRCLAAGTVGGLEGAVVERAGVV